ncbi:MAG: ATP-binding cassette domain-containing protein [Methanobrevibacter sp.]|uniref:ABC transporter ATP-binding protein n=1 Tax=Methanobrevibacter sp. TaxID=66852 RepID=UPI0026DEB1DC|nr:ABC transporter ATP-binding protein [Methanobrevibacter sp.]MDO5848190.1 ATP-binding cassette domain-containing protein [Methanobrevibacter sp.]
MAQIEIKDFDFSYIDEEGKAKKCLKNINLEVEEGDFILLCGPSGCGKTTLLSNLKKELIPNGEKSGTIKYDGTEISNLDELTSACDIGYLFQNPDSQLVMDTVIQEIAFPLENIGLPTDEIRNRVSEIVTFFGINDILHKNVNELSGGQKQLVNLCSLLTLRPKVLLLDEPTSQLDPIATHDFISILNRLNEEFSISIILSEHKADHVFSSINRLVFMKDGTIEYSGNPYEIAKESFSDETFIHYLPSVSRLYNLLSKKYPILNEIEVPLTIREGRKCLNLIHDQLMKMKDNGINLENDYGNMDVDKEKPYVIKADGLYFAYEKHNLVLKNINLEIYENDYISIIGGNGSGKSTLLELMAGLLDPIKGKIKYKKGLKIGFVYQNPMIHFSKDTVKEELISSINIPDEYREQLMELDDYDLITDNELNEITYDNSSLNFEKLINLFGIGNLLSRNPYDCSGGEQQKIVIMKTMLQDTDILILDEPTKALDPISSLKLAKIFEEIRKDGMTIVMTSHDLPFVANNCERCLMLFDKDIQIDTFPKAIFRENNFYTTFINRMVKNYCPKCVTIPDVRKKWDL